MNENGSSLRLVEEDFSSTDLSFIRNNSDITYELCESIEEFSKLFFNSVEEESPNFNTFVLEGLDFIKYSSKSVVGSPVLTYSIRIDNEGKCYYHLMGVK